MKKAPEKPYTLKEVSAIHNIPIDTLKYRCVRRKLRPSVINGKYMYNLSYNEMISILNNDSKVYLIPEIIYVHTTWLVLESKMNKK
jgi:hypothetical protein